MRLLVLFAFAAVPAFGSGGCAPHFDHARTPVSGLPLREVARFDEQPTGIALGPGGRTFVSFPNWWREPTDDVVELLSGGATRPYPDRAWNDSGFVCVQSVQVDRRGATLWIVDAGYPLRVPRCCVAGGPKLVAVDLATNTVTQVIHFDERSAPCGSYLNDVQVDSVRRWAYLTDSERGALVVVDLATGVARRVLEGAPATTAEPGVVPVVGGRPWRTFFGVAPRVHADGIALDATGDWLYFRALTAHGLHRVPTALLRDASVSAATLARAVETVGRTSAADGMAFGDDGALYFTALEHDAIERRRADGVLEVVARDPRIRWPDSIAIRDGRLFFTTSEIHATWPFNDFVDAREERYGLFAVDLVSAP